MRLLHAQKQSDFSLYLAVFCLLFFFASYNSLNAQNAFKDALELSKYIDETGSFERKDSVKMKKWIGILSKYLVPIEDSIPIQKLTNRDVVDCYLYSYFEPYDRADTPNVFLKPLLPTWRTESSDETLIENKKVKEGKKNSIFSQIGGLKVNRFVDGLAQFLIERSQEELYVSYFKKLQETFKEYPEFEELMPQVHDFVALFQSYQYKEMIPVVREGFKKDLENLPNHLLRLKHLSPADCPYSNDVCRKRMKEYQDFFSKDESKFFIATNILLNQLIEGANPVEMMEILNNHDDFEELEDFDGLAKNFVNGMKMVEFFSNNLRHEERESYEPKAKAEKAEDKEKEGYGENDSPREIEEKERLWVSKEEWKKIDRTTFRIFMGLLYQQKEAEEIYFMIKGKEVSLRDILGEFAENINPIEEYVTTFVKRTNAIDMHLGNIEAKKRANEEFSYRDYYTYYNSVLDLVQHFFDFDDFLGEYVPDLNSSKKADHFLDMADLCGEIYFDLHTKHFNTAVLNTIMLLDKSIVDSSNTFKSSKFRKQFLKYGSFMASLAEAENADAAKVVLEGTVMPVGSARVKRDNKNNVSLNAYLGAFGGGEYLSDLGEWKGSIGIYAPVGVAFSWGNRDRLTKKVDKGTLLPYKRDRLEKWLQTGDKGLLSKDERKGLEDLLKKQEKGSLSESEGDSLKTLLKKQEKSLLSPEERDSLQRIVGKKKMYQSRGSWSLFLSVLDIGAVTAFRIDDDSTEVLPELRLENILAPGLHIVKGFANSPLSWGVGIQAGPMLRTIRGEEGLEPKAIFNNKLNYRLHAFLAVDIPLINFKTRDW